MMKKKLLATLLAGGLVAASAHAQSSFKIRIPLSPSATATSQPAPGGGGTTPTNPFAGAPFTVSLNGSPVLASPANYPVTTAGHDPLGATYGDPVPITDNGSSAISFGLDWGSNPAEPVTVTSSSPYFDMASPQTPGTGHSSIVTTGTIWSDYTVPASTPDGTYPVDLQFSWSGGSAQLRINVPVRNVVVSSVTNLTAPGQPPCYGHRLQIDGANLDVIDSARYSGQGLAFRSADGTWTGAPLVFESQSATRIIGTVAGWVALPPSAFLVMQEGNISATPTLTTCTAG